MTILKAITSIVSVFKIVLGAYDKYKAHKIHKHYEEKRKVLEEVRAALEKEIGKPKEEQSDEELRKLHRRLVNMGHTK